MSVTEKSPAGPRSVVAVICAAGSGVRAGREAPKQYADVGGRPMLARSARIFLDHPAVDRVTIVIGASQKALYDAALKGLADHPKLTPPVEGGASRQASVRAGLEALAPDMPDIVLVHDAARPFAARDIVSRAIDAARRAGGAVPGAPVTDTICEVAADGSRGATLDRAGLRALQTPQAFRYADLRDAHARAAAAGRDDFTDDGALFAWAGGEVTVFDGEARNVKMTTPDQFEDEALRRAGLAFLARGDVRTGTGFDVHAFGPGDHVMLAGVPVPHSAGLSGHSDADVALHALTDAILGALADGDIGAHFPPSDAKWKGMDSSVFLADAAERVRAAGGEIAHLDLTVIGEAPKVGPHREAMRARIAEIVGVSIGRVGVKATTTERLGFAGRREGLAAMASATIRLPFREDFEPMAEAYELAEEVLRLARGAGLTIATAESCTGGLVAAALTEVPGSSEAVDRGFVTYSNAAKTEMLGVPEKLIEAHGAVSEEVARAMAAGALKASGASLAVAITGVAGPGGGTEAKPVGLVHFAAVRQGAPAIHRERRFGDVGRAEVRRLSVLVALEMLCEAAGKTEAA